jgi:hypothetical protein
MRGRFWSVQLLLGITSAVFLGYKSRRTHDHTFTVSNLRLHQTGGPGSCIYFPQEQGSPVIPPGIGLARSTKSNSKLYHDRWSVGQSVSVSGTHLGYVAKFFFSFFFLIILRHLRVCWCGAPSLMRCRIWSLLLGLTSAVFLGSESRRTNDHTFTISNLRLHQSGGPGSCIDFPQEQGSIV